MSQRMFLASAPQTGSDSLDVKRNGKKEYKAKWLLYSLQTTSVEVCSIW